MNIEEVTGLPLRTLSYGAISGDAPLNIVLFLHGLGSNAEDLISLAPIMSPQLRNTLFLAVDAPEACDMAPMGYQWFSLQDRSETKMIAGVKSTQTILKEYLSAIKDKYDIKNKDLTLCGFSQGTMVALYTALLYPEPLAGVLGYSGALILDNEQEESLTKLPIFLVHGELDDIVPFSSLNQAKQLLESKNIPIEALPCPDLRHSIDEKGLISGTHFLQSVLNPKRF